MIAGVVVGWVGVPIGWSGGTAAGACVRGGRDVEGGRGVCVSMCVWVALVVGLALGWTELVLGWVKLGCGFPPPCPPKGTKWSVSNAEQVCLSPVLLVSSCQLPVASLTGLF